MQTNIKVSKYVDPFKAKAFLEAYGHKVIIEVTNKNDLMGNWIEQELIFKTGEKNYTLTEYFKDGEDNSTDHVVLNLGDKDDTYNTFIEAELILADTIRRNNGDSK